MQNKFKLAIIIILIISGFLFFIFNKTKSPFSPEKRPKIVIDPGHGGADPGATYGNVYEKDINLVISKKLKEYLIDHGFLVVMTREDDRNLSLWQRIVIVNKEKPDLFVSVHVNSAPDTRLKGAEVYWYTPQSYSLAQKIKNNFSSHSLIGQTQNIFRSRFYVLRNTNIPSVIVETGYMSNKKDRRDLFNNKRQKKTAKAIGKGIIQFLDDQKKADKSKNR